MNPTSLAALVATALAFPAFAATTRVAEKHGDIANHAEALVLNHTILAAADGAAMQGDAWKRWADDFSHNLRADMNTLFATRIGSAKVVKGAPYGAEIITEANQQLADGNVISRISRGSIHRDGEGRTRQQTPSDGKGGTLHLTDPVAGKRYLVTQGGKKAIVLPMGHMAIESREKADKIREKAERAAERAKEHAERAAERSKERSERASNRQVVRMNGTEIRVEDGRVFIDGQERTGPVEHRTPGGKNIVVENGKVLIDGKELTVPTPPAVPGHRNVIVQRVGPGETGDGTRREEVRVQVIRSHDGREIVLPPLPPTPPLPPDLSGLSGMATPPVPPLPPMPGIQTLRFESTAKLGKGVTTQLGNKEFDGVRAEGRSTVWTIPAGDVGNKKPINITSESWYSAELQVTVMSRYHDPRTGESIYRLANIQRGEPAADLFKVPEEAISRDHSKR